MTEARDELPPEFDPLFYRTSNPDLAAVSDEALLDHYRTWGIAEGRHASPVAERMRFVAEVIGTESGRILEVGPYAAPLVRGPKVRYLDIAPTEVLRARAQAEGRSPGLVPAIHYVGHPDAMPRSFDAAVACRSIGHHPDLIGHLQSIGRVLVEGGRYYLVVPDRRRTMVPQVACAGLARLIAAHREKRQRHALEHVIADRALRLAPHLRRSDPDAIVADRAPLIEQAVAEHHCLDEHADVEAWHFTPESMRQLLASLFALELSPFQPVRLWQTAPGADEFCAVLEKPGR